MAVDADLTVTGWRPKECLVLGNSEKPRRHGSMAEQYVGKTAEFKDGDRRIIFAGDNEIGVFRHEGQFYAYSNFCLHQGVPRARASPSPRSRSGCCPTRP